ncbi:hypothetical protein BC941DRAFT_503630 [Chlamydoabsidia padenii]|nr:hypothetical protein BC941DRAFT_503630 [Chlamydoabsidia padenii]
MLQTMKEENQGRFVLPPISALDEYKPPHLSPVSPPRTSFEKIMISDNPQQQQALRTISSDADQVVQHAHSLCDNMTHYKPYLLSTTQHAELQPWMDDMIGKANQVLNALLRLRKHQMIAAPIPKHYATLTRSSPPPPSLPSPPSSARITITKRDWPSQQQHFYHKNNIASIPSRQRKRGKRATFQGRCHSCNISETPEWRRGPDGARTLCNACGLHYAKLARKKDAHVV